MVQQTVMSPKEGGQESTVLMTIQQGGDSDGTTQKEEKDQLMSNSSSMVHLQGNKRLTPQTKTAFALTLATLALLTIVTLSVHTLKYFNLEGSLSSSSSTTSNSQLRDLEENDDMNFADFTCDDIFIETEPGSEERCAFAQTCNSSSGLFASFVFCQTYDLSTLQWCCLLSPLLLIWLVVLFRMLGSTAEDFFSPSLEMFSLKMGLPPRFAGVTLLALGNGAADVSATISAIVQNPEEGYQMSLGALTGAGMFVGTVVAGIVIVTADGVRCRGALMRDVVMLAITVLVVFLYFYHGEIGKSAIQCFLLFYTCFVVVVLIADIYHRRVVLPAIRQNNEEQELEERRREEMVESVEGLEGFEDNVTTQPGEGGGLGSGSAAAVSFVSGTDDNRRKKEGEVEMTVSTTKTEEESYTTAKTNLSPVNEDGESLPSPPSLPRPTLPTQQKKKNRKKKGILRKVTDTIAIAFSNYERTEGKASAKDNFKSGWGSQWVVTTQEADKPVRLHGTDGILGSRSETETDNDSDIDSKNGELASTYTALLDEVDNICGVEGNAGLAQFENLRRATWKETWSSGGQELRDHFVDMKKDIFENEENGFVDKFFLVCELPFTLLRKFTISIPCEGYYCRALVAISLALTPLWIATYALIQRDTNLFQPKLGIAVGCTVLLAILFLRFAPTNAEVLSLGVAVPIAFIGFIMAATWIDTIADQLVKLLTFLGVICRIPNSIMGLTVLAWGNSMGDLSANMTMAKKGLANMAITACFAGPVFNILIGLGGGFYQLNNLTGVDETDVVLSKSALVGFCFLIANCLLVLLFGLLIQPGYLTKAYGYTALGMYAVYVITSVALQILGDD